MSGRPRTIDRDKVLDAAEAIVSRVGASGLTFEAVARAAGITKGGVQYCFGTKENLIHAMILRWGTAFDAAVEAHQAGDTSPQARIRAHILATRDSDDAENARSAVMMTALLQSPEQVADSRDWYNDKLAGLDLNDPADLRTTIAFLAAEGTFFLRAFRLLDLPDQDWDRLQDSIVALVSAPKQP